ncbi:MAG: S-adenosylmethionine:tRNA ribosyltransferase-isomerase [Alphaproteobacteria bacterium]
MRVSDFDFDLPEDLIALRPARPRDAARLLEVRHGELTHRIVRDLPNLIAPGDCLVFNETTVMHAQLEGPARRARSDARDRGCRAAHRVHAAQEDRARCVARCQAGAQAQPRGPRLFETLSAEIIAKDLEGDFLLRFFSWRRVDEAVAKAGVMPLPPYIAARRPPDEKDEVIIKLSMRRPWDGCGADRRPPLLAGTDALAANGIAFARVTLHVGAGTFRR